MFTHVLIASALAPFLLLRTKETTEHSAKLTMPVLIFFIAMPLGPPIRTIRYIRQVFFPARPELRTRRYRYLRKALLFFSYLLFVAIGIPVTFLLVWLHSIILLFFWALLAVCISAIKVYVTAYGICTQPIDVVSNVPANWRKIVLLVDSLQAPEIFPGFNESLTTHDILAYFHPSSIAMMHTSLIRFAYKWYVIYLKRARRRPMHLFACLVGLFPTLLSFFAWTLCFFVLYIGPALAYRWSLKSTAIIWSPLLWFFRPIKGTDKPVLFADCILTLSINKISRLYSLVILMLFLLKVASWLGWSHFTALLRHNFGDLFVDRFVVPETILTWQLAAVINSFITFWIYHESETYLLAVKHLGVEEQHNKYMERFYKSTFLTRNILSVYTSLCSLYITASIVTKLELPPLRLILVPW